MSTPLSIYEVNLTLRYICPPSQLALSPLPAHLVSRPLLQRHHFLGIDPGDDVKGYLMWASEQDDVFTRLEGLDPPTAGDEEPVMGIKYTADQESVFAHAELRSLASHTSAEIRLVFLFDPIDSAWKYHNIASMPFPSGAMDSVTAAVAHDTSSAEIQKVEVAGGDDDDSDDEYWNSYANGDGGGSLSRNKSKDGDLSEDAYWAQYANVQGTADSTVHSPKRSPRQEESTYDDALARARGVHSDSRPGDERESDVIDVSYRSLNIPDPSLLLSQDPHDASCPQELCSRLDALPPRLSHSPSLNSLSSFDGTNVITNGHPPVTNGSVDAEAEGSGSSASLTPEPPSSEGVDVTEAVKSGIRGIFNLWKISTPEKLADQEEFMVLVREALVG